MDHDSESAPILRTSPGRMLRGIAIVGVTLAIAGAITLVMFDAMIANPPPVALQPRPGPEPGPTPTPTAGTTKITMLAGASVQGAPDYEPDAAEIPLGNKVVWVNADTAIHTATSGTGPTEEGYGQAFDTSFVDPGAESDPIEITDAAVGDAFEYFCLVHPFMTSTLTIVEAEAGGAPDSSIPAGTLTILSGAAVQGAPDYDPDPMTVKVGDEIHIFNDDNVPHTVTSGTGPSDETSGQAFNTGIMEPEQLVELTLANVSPGEYDYYCMVHPFMLGKLNVT